MNRLIILLLISLPLIASSQEMTSLPKSVIDDYAYSALNEFEYGTGGFKAIIFSRLASKGYGQIDVATGMESLKTNTAFRNATLEALYWHIGDNRDYVFVNLTAIGMKAMNAKILTDYILLKFPLENRRNREKSEEEDQKNLEKVKIGVRKQYDDLMNSYLSGAKYINVDNLDLTTLIPSLSVLDVEKQLQVVVPEIKTSFMIDSLMPFIQKHFENDLIYFNVTKAGELVSIRNKTNTVSFNIKDYPELKRWIRIGGPYRLEYKGSVHNISYEYAGLQIASRSCTNSDFYYFTLDKNEIEHVTDTTKLVKNALSTIGNKSGICSKNIYFKFATDPLKEMLLSYTASKDIKDFRKATNTHSKTGAGFLKAGLTIATGVPLILTETERNENLFRFNISTDKQMTYLFAKGEPKAIRTLEGSPTKVSYNLAVFNGEKKDFIEVPMK